MFLRPETALSEAEVGLRRSNYGHSVVHLRVRGRSPNEGQEGRFFLVREAVIGVMSVLASCRSSSRSRKRPVGCALRKRATGYYRSETESRASDQMAQYTLGMHHVFGSHKRQTIDEIGSTSDWTTQKVGGGGAPEAFFGGVGSVSVRQIWEPDPRRA